MKLVTYDRDGAARLGAVAADQIVDLAMLADAAGETLPCAMIDLIALGEDGLASARRLMAAHDGNWPAGTARPIEGARLLAPIPRLPKGVIGVGLNYAEHVEESSRTMDTARERPSHPVIFFKPPTAVVGHEAPILHNAAQTRQMDWESELGVVIGRTCRNVGTDAAMGMVFGYTCVNDISARDLRHGGQWCFAKGQDSFAPMGPCIVTADEIPDPHTLRIGLRVNGVTKQDGNTGQMIFRVPDLIAHLSSGITLEPGDVIATGSPSGVGISFTPPQFLQPGDVVEVEVEGIGVLRNPVVAV
ncbi:fumarylacetoacetate hydrolase family protein (plasmid) [Tistrella bauzanensis]|uniref:Fumarylacetoacetate hydrolase family protein n=1 Tax=Tistrella arctica TaxID=3133430 RepID=A0ABU9YNG8_9PROT